MGITAQDDKRFIPFAALRLVHGAGIIKGERIPELAAAVRGFLVSALIKIGVVETVAKTFDQRIADCSHIDATVIGQRQFQTRSPKFPNDYERAVVDVFVRIIDISRSPG